MWLGRLYVGVGITARGKNGANDPWFGFCYGSWIPRFNYNGGRIKRREVFDVSWYWLCFHGCLTIWPIGAGNWFWKIPRKK